MSTTALTMASIEAKLANCQVELSEEEYETLRRVLVVERDSHDESVPTMQRLTTKSSGLVRYRGMVQDMLDPQYYYQKQSNDGSEPVDLASELQERQPLLLVPLPFASDWTTTSTTNPNHLSTTHTIADMDVDEDSKESKKRNRVEEMEMPPSIKKLSVGSPTTTAEFSNNNRRHQYTNWWPAGCLGSNPKEMPVLAHFYYDVHKGPTLRLNDVVEVIGILDPSDATVMYEPDFEDDFFGLEEQMPANLPTLHAVCYRKVDLEDMVTPVTEPNTTVEVDNVLERMKHICTATLGNEAAAEALLLTLFSMAEREGNDVAATKTVDDETTLGCASLRLVLESTNACKATAQQLQLLLHQWCAVVGLIELNDKSVVSPAKTGLHMEKSPLQLPKGSVLIIVENRMDGKLSSRDVETLEALQSLTKNHRVPYRFDGGACCNFEADYRVIVLSAKTRCKLLECTTEIHLPQQEVAPSHLWSSEDSSQIRDYVARRRQSNKGKNNNVALGKNVLEVAQKDFIERRQLARTAGCKSVEVEDFHRWLTLTRLHARSRGRCLAIVEDWKHALRVDDAMTLTSS